MTFSIVATQVQNLNASSSAERDITVPAGVVQPGDTIIVGYTHASGGITVAFSGDTSSSYTPAGSHVYSGHTSAMWFKPNAQPSDAGTVLKFTPSGSVAAAVVLVVVRGLATTAALDAISVFISATAEGGTSQPGNSKTATTATVDTDCAAIQFAFVPGGLATGPAPMTSITASGMTLAAATFDSHTTQPVANAAAFYNAGPYSAGSAIGGNAFTGDNAASNGNWAIWTLAFKLAGTPSASASARPVAVAANPGNWANVGGAADAAAALADENDGTGAQSPLITAGPYSIDYTLSPLSAGLVTISGRAKLTAAGSQTLTLTLKQGSTVIASWSDPVTSTGFADFSHDVTSAQNAAITDRSALTVELTAS